MDLTSSSNNTSYNINLPHLSNNQSIENRNESKTKIKKSSDEPLSLINSFKLSPILFKFLILIFLPLWIWLSFFTIFVSENLPGGSIFILVILACVGRLLGYLAQLLKLPPMIGMLGLGLAIRNIPYIDFGKNLNPSWSAPIRQIALAVILTRAGLGLDLKILIKLKFLIARFAIFPTLFESVTVAIASHFILDFPWAWAFLLGCVIAPVSPAVVVPRLLELREKGYGVAKGIPTFIIASACLDNVLAICLFGVVLNFVFPNGNLTMTIIQGPLQVLIGLAFGIIWGIFNGIIFNSKQENDNNVQFIRFVVTFCGGVISIVGSNKIGYSGAGALGCLLSSFTAACLWRSRNIFSGVDPLVWQFYILWYIFEPLLFGVIGCQIDIFSLDLQVVYKGVACILIGLSVRMIVSVIMVTGANLTIREKLFASIAWIAKATVQAAIGPIALDMVLSKGYNEREKFLGESVLTLAVLSILLTAIVGESGVIITGPKFLTKN